MKLTKTLFSALLLASFAFAADEAKPVPAADTAKTVATEAPAEVAKVDSAKVEPAKANAVVPDTTAKAAEQAAPAPSDTVKTDSAKTETNAPVDSAKTVSADSAKTDTAKIAEPVVADSVATAQADSAKADTSEVLEAKAVPADTAKVDSVAAAPVDSMATVQADSAKTETAEAQPAPEEKSEARTAGQTIMENPLEFIIVSAAFIASVLVIIFTGKD